MSVEKAKGFLVELTNSRESAAKAREAYLEAMMKVAGELGYEIEEQDLRSAMHEMSDLSELSEEALEEVAAGGTCRTCGYNDSLGVWIVGPIPTGSSSRLSDLSKKE